MPTTVDVDASDDLGSVDASNGGKTLRLGLAGKADTPVNDLSRGMKQKVSLACTLARDVDVAFLDEPTLGLDVESAVELRRELRRLAEEEGLEAHAESVRTRFED